MSQPYQEILSGECLLRHPPGFRHEQICNRLHQAVDDSLADISSTRLLPPRTVVQLVTGTLIRPDLALVTSATGKVWLIAEVVDKMDHQPDTVIKKSLYEDVRLPRLWMIDPRYDNVEVYHGTPYGLSLKEILAHRDELREKLLPALALGLKDLFQE